MPFHVANRRTPLDSLRERYGGVPILDLTSRGPEPWVRFSPFFPHGGIPVPFTPERTGASVEGIWQGLKVFETADVDPSRLRVTSMTGLKRSTRKYGKVLGHRAGLQGERLLSYAEARMHIYLPTYRWVLENHLYRELERLRELEDIGDVVLLDYETNCDPDDLSRPLSHAGLVKLFLEGAWPPDGA